MLLLDQFFTIFLQLLLALSKGLLVYLAYLLEFGFRAFCPVVVIKHGVGLDLERLSFLDCFVLNTDCLFEVLEVFFVFGQFD